jgi:uncharacterized protein (TIGR02271 family)
MANIVVGLYNGMQQAYEVISRLREAGFEMRDISIITNETRRSSERGFDDTMRGQFKDMKQHKLAGIGNVYATGPLARHMGDNMRLADAFSQMGARADDADLYMESLRRGNTLVAVEAEGHADEAVRIMSELNALPGDRMAEHWRKSGWERFDERAKPYTAEQMDREGKEILPIIEEEVRVGKREVNRGGVRVHSRVIENPVEKSVNLRDEQVHVERRRTDRPASDADFDAFQERTIEVQETSEEAVVDKQARVVEEIVVDKTSQERQETIRDVERRTEVDVERTGGASGGANLNRFDDDFQRHYDRHYTGSGMNYERFRPAYQYGYTHGKRYQGRNWSDIEAEARRDWEREHSDSPWERFKDAVREGFERARR